MKKGPVFVAVLAVVAAYAVTPNAAFAQRGRGVAANGGGRVFVGAGGRAVVGTGARVFVGSSGSRAVVAGGGRGAVTPGFAHPAHPIFIHKPPFFFHRPFFPFGVGVVAAAPVVWGAPYYPSDYSPYYQQPYYDPSMSYYSAPAAYAGPPAGNVAVAPAPPQAPPSPTVVEFSTGRYELRGDGVNTPYSWVWIPNAPTSPPPAAPTGPPVDPSSGSGQAPPRAGRLYRWTDAQGVIYWTDRLDAVPEQYRSRVKSTSS